MDIIKALCEMDLEKYPNMTKQDDLDFEEMFNKLVFGDHKRYPLNKELEYGAGVLLKALQEKVKKEDGFLKGFE